MKASVKAGSHSIDHGASLPPAVRLSTTSISQPSVQCVQSPCNQRARAGAKVAVGAESAQRPDRPIPDMRRSVGRRTRPHTGDRKGLQVLEAVGCDGHPMERIRAASVLGAFLE